jgi:hypothetical protein
MYVPRCGLGEMVSYAISLASLRCRAIVKPHQDVDRKGKAQDLDAEQTFTVGSAETTR